MEASDMVERIAAKINKRYLLVSLIIVCILGIFNMCIFSGYFSNVANGSLYMEINMGYMPEDLFAIAERYGDAGRNLYIVSALSLDLLLPLFVGNLLAAGALFLVNKNGREKKVYKRIFAFGIATCLSDWLENLCMIGVIRSYTQPQMAFAVLARILTSIKYILMIVFVVVLLREFIRYKRKNVNS